MHCTDTLLQSHFPILSLAKLAAADVMKLVSLQTKGREYKLDAGSQLGYNAFSETADISPSPEVCQSLPLCNAL